MERSTGPVALHSLQLLGFLRQGRNIRRFGKKTDEDMKSRDIDELNDFDIDSQDDENKELKQERKKKEIATIKKVYMIRMGKRDGSLKRPVIKKIFLTRLGKRSG